MRNRLYCLDVGGEGRHEFAWNVDPRATRTLGPSKGFAIPRLIQAKADAIPVSDGSIALVIVERCPLLRPALNELKRIVSKHGTIILRHTDPMRRFVDSSGVNPSKDYAGRETASLAVQTRPRHRLNALPPHPHALAKSVLGTRCDRGTFNIGKQLLLQTRFRLCDCCRVDENYEFECDIQPC